MQAEKTSEAPPDFLMPERPEVHPAPIKRRVSFRKAILGFIRKIGKPRRAGNFCVCGSLLSRYDLMAGSATCAFCAGKHRLV